MIWDTLSKAQRSARQEFTADKEGIMPQFDAELVQLMRGVLEDAMTKVPMDIPATTAKAYLAEAILKSAAQGHTSYDELLNAAVDQIHTIVSMLT